MAKSALSGNSDTQALFALADQMKIARPLTDLAPQSSGADEHSDAAVDGTIREMAALQLENDARRRQAVQDALIRVRQGVYGICTACDKRIPQVRLDVLPATETCVGCAQSRES